MAERGSEAFERATEHTIDALKAAGVEVVEAMDEMVEEVLGLAEMHKQKKHPKPRPFKKNINQLSFRVLMVQSY